jgi:anti-sigma B factor antagonist
VTAAYKNQPSHTVSVGSAGARSRTRSVVVHVAGDFDIGTQPILRQALSRAQAANADVLLDLSDVTFVDASSLGVLMDARRTLADRGHTFRIVNPGRAVTRVLALTDLTSVLMPATAC